MSDMWLFALLLIAVAIGWLMGRYGRAGATKNTNERIAGELPKSYFRGLNYLINEQPDGAIDTFVRALDVNSETLETHIALGNLLRRRGEVDRAIRVHQNLLARPRLSQEQLHQSQLELARDYIAAGLLDRAERLLLDLIEVSVEQKTVCLKLLIEIYRDEREWKKAINAANSLSSKLSLNNKRNNEFSVPLAHFCCEIAEEALRKQDYHEVRKQVRQALTYDGGCVRANLLLATLEYNQEQYAKALKTLHRIPQQSPDFILESIELVAKCSDKLNDARVLQRYIEKCFDVHKGIDSLLPFTDELMRVQDQATVAAYLIDQLKERPSIKGISHYISLQLQKNTLEAPRDTLQFVKELIDKLVRNRPAYRCRRCGFTGSKLHWLCPSCKEYGTVCRIDSD